MKKIPNATARRIPIYYQGVLRLKQAGIEKISSTELADYLSIESTTIRRDFTYLGELGVTGYGYKVVNLEIALANELGDIDEDVIIIGVGHLGQALMAFNKNNESRIKIVKAFDIDEKLVGTTIHGIKVFHIDDLEKAYKNEALVILTVNFDSATDILKRLNDLKIKGVMNFTSQRFDSNKKLIVHNVDLSVDLLMLSYFVQKNGGIL